MKKRTYLIILAISSMVLSFSINSCKVNINEKEYLQKVLNNLEKIKSASYFSTLTASAPEDTVKFTEPIELFYRIYINPSDTLVGSISATFPAEDTSRMTDFYDGKVRGKVNKEEQYVKIDSFKHHPYPFRLVYYPFYTRINEIIKYALTTKDSIRTDFKDYGDSVFFSLKIINKHVYFHIKPIVIKNEYIPDDEISQFDIWFSKKDDMPYRMRSKWHHQTCFESCKKARFNVSNNIAFHPTDYYPSHFEVRYVDPYASMQVEQPNSLEGIIAPKWALKDIDNNVVKLDDLKSRVILLQFTGVGCGPCHHSIPFLKNLVEEYKTKDFVFVSIETWSNNIEGLKRYSQKNGFNFRFLKSTDAVTKSYEINSVPTFFIIDRKRIIRKVIKGFDRETTNKEIKDCINKYL